MKRVVFHTGRRGISMVECVILVIVLMIAVGAVFTTLGMAQRNYASHIQDKRAREVLFAWHQAFESMWPPNTDYADTSARWATLAKDQIEKTNAVLGYGVSSMDNSTTPPTVMAQAGGFRIDVKPSAPVAGRLDLDITIRMSSGKIIVNKVRRSYNIFSHETVSDDLS